MAIEMRRTMIRQPIVICSMQNGFIEVEEFLFRGEEKQVAYIYNIESHGRLR